MFGKDKLFLNLCIVYWVEGLLISPGFRV